MREFIIQRESTEHGPIVSPEGAALLDALRFRDWRDDGATNSVTFAESPANKPLAAVPVGSVEFVNEHLQNHGLPGLYQETVPECLRSEELLGRRVVVGSAENAKELRGSSLFVKPAVNPKRFEAQVIPRAMLSAFSDRGPLFISEVLSDIVSEWRVFVRHGSLFDLRPYAYASWPEAPDKQAVRYMIDCYENQPSVYALDVAVLSDKRTVLIETHNFIAIGLYGFESASLPSMYLRAWHEYLNRAKMGK